MHSCHRRWFCSWLLSFFQCPCCSADVHNLLSIRQFTAYNSYAIEFDSSGLTVKDSASRRPFIRCDSTGPLYTLRLPSSAAPLSPPSSAAFAATPSSTTWHRRLGHPGRDVLAQLSRSTDVPGTRAPAEHLKASRPLIRVLVINDNDLWINNFIRDNEHRLIHG